LQLIPQVKEQFVFIPGAEKCGSSNLYHTLGAHSRISRSATKEPHFLALERNTVIEHLPLYQGLFPRNTATARMEASQSYLYSKRAPANIKELFSSPKILIMLRDPARRVFSSYYHMHKKLPRGEKRSLESIIGKFSRHDIASVIQTEREQLHLALEQNAVIRNYFGPGYMHRVWGVPFESHFEDPHWTYRYFQGSIYSYYAEHWESIFGDDVRVIILEELIDKPTETLAGILDFLGLDHEEQCLEPASYKNPTQVPANFLSRAYLKVRQDNIILESFLSALKKWGLEKPIGRMHDALYYKPKLDRETYEAIRDILQEEYDYWFSRVDYLQYYWKYRQTG
jgi:hypothetical protein